MRYCACGAILERRIKRWSRVGFILIAGGFILLEPAAGEQEPERTSGHDALARRVEAVLAAPGYERGHWGVLVVDRKTGQAIYDRNAEHLFSPASVTKLFSTAAALIELGPGYRFQTPVVRHGEVDAKGKLHGELILVARGDLCMGGRTGPEGTLMFKDEDHTYSSGNLRSEIVGTNPLAGLDHLAREVEAGGIREIAGDVIVDDRLFAPAVATGSGPSRISPIVINDNVIDVLARPAGKVGEPASVTIQPVTQSVMIDAVVETVEAGKPAALTVEQVGPQRYAVRGQLPLGHSQVVKIGEIEHPASFARSLLIEALRRRGVRVAASPLGSNNASVLPPRGEVIKLPKVAEYTSPPFSEYARVILKVSHNLHASTLPLLIAAHHGERTLAEGLKREGGILKTVGLEPGTISFGGGAGGARSDLVSPRATVNLLRAMAARPEFAAFDAALPVLGRDGTLAKSVGADSPARGHAHAKTGTYFVENDLDGTTVLTSKALAGYLETASGRSLVFAVFVNNVPLDAPKPNRSISDATAQAGRLLGKLCEALYADSGDAVGQAKGKEAVVNGAAP
jgi:serine-type D-Ala-D-Ala carboxypeptidase/endopeptidase (penicillin-binding protein 4)